MTIKDNETLTNVSRQGFDLLAVNTKPDFLAELGLEINFVRSFFDPIDGLPVTELKVVTNAISKDHNGNMHPGALCTMMDHLSTFCVFADPHWWVFPDGTVDSLEIAPHIADRIGLELGLSRNIKLHQQLPVTAGSTIRFVTKVLENTPKSTYFFSQMFNDQGELVATGHHDKVKLTKPVLPKL